MEPKDTSGKLEKAKRLKRREALKRIAASAAYVGGIGAVVNFLSSCEEEDLPPPYTNYSSYADSQSQYSSYLNYTDYSSYANYKSYSSYASYSSYGSYSSYSSYSSYGYYLSYGYCFYGDSYPSYADAYYTNWL
jgi:hypothetical protein